MEQKLVRMAFRKSYFDLVKELSKEPTNSSEFHDSYWLLSALKIVVIQQKNFDKFDKAAQLVSLLRTSLPEELILSDGEFHQLIFLMKLMYILSKVGHESTAHLLTLLREQLGAPEVGKKCENDVKNHFMTGIFRESRMYVLRLMLKNPRIEHFAQKKFPDTFKDLICWIEGVVSKVLEHAWMAYPLTDLEMYERGVELDPNSTLKSDPGFVLYSEMFPCGRLVSEQDLLFFLEVLRSPKMSLTPPNFFCSDRELTASEDLFAENSGDFLGPSNGPNEEVEEDELSLASFLPSANREPEERPKILVRLEPEILVKPCSVILEKMTESFIEGVNDMQRNFTTE